MRRLLLVVVMLLSFLGVGLASSCIVRTHPDHHHRGVKRGHHNQGKHKGHKKPKKHKKHRR
jgi:hypothetical protein